MAVGGLFIALAAMLPLSPQPAPPFPKIITDAPTITQIAPGVAYGDYQMLTEGGPLRIHVLAVDLHDPTVRVAPALAQDHLVSQGETVSSMAQRTGAVAGINGDYFDINQTNQPLNILLEHGALVRMPMHRWAIAFDKDNDASFAEFEVAAQAELPGGILPLKTINDWPPPGGGAVLITPDYGALSPQENVTDFRLAPVDGTPQLGTYRVDAIADNTQPQPPGYYLALGLNAYGANLPDVGQTISVSATSTPPLDDLVSAIGGGPLLVKDGAWYADPDGPNRGEFATLMPATAAATTGDGTLLLFEVDGRQPALSIGVLQPQLAALMIAFGATTGMQFDGGGSSTLVARTPGNTDATAQNDPSDGLERRVGDALLVYSDAPYGPAARLDAQPQVVRAFPGARVPIRIAVTDAAGHPAPPCTCAIRLRVIPAQAGTMDANTFAAGDRPQDAVVRVERGDLRMDLPVHVSSAVARVVILPSSPVVPTNGSLQLRVQAFDAQGFAIALPDRLPWSAEGATIDDDGLMRANTRNAIVRVRLGDRLAQTTITVGEHLQTLSLHRATFVTAPRNGPGSLALHVPCSACVTLHYDFTTSERAAYVAASTVLPQRAMGIAADVYGDANGEILRLAVNNAINERFWYTVATIDWRGWKHVVFRFPPALPQPITFKALYVINRVGPMKAVNAAGAISLRNVRTILAGSQNEAPKYQQR